MIAGLGPTETTSPWQTQVTITYSSATTSMTGEASTQTIFRLPVIAPTRHRHVPVHLVYEQVDPEWERAMRKLDHPCYPWPWQQRHSPERTFVETRRLPKAQRPKQARCTGAASAWRCRKGPWA